MPRRTRSLQGDTVDLIARRAYADTSMTVAILEANPGLPRLGPVLPAGTLIVLPDKAPAKAAPLTLW